MNPSDVVNAAFELLAGFAILGHCRVLWRDRQVKGISIASTLFFTAWGYWNLYYYPALGQWMSFFGGISVVVANTLWVVLLIYFGVILPKRTAAQAAEEAGAARAIQTAA